MIWWECFRLRTGGFFGEKEKGEFRRPCGGFLLEPSKRNQKMSGGMAAYENTTASLVFSLAIPPDPRLRGTHDCVNGSCGRRGKMTGYHSFPCPQPCHRKVRSDSELPDGNSLLRSLASPLQFAPAYAGLQIGQQHILLKARLASAIVAAGAGSAQNLSGSVPRGVHPIGGTAVPPDWSF